MVLRRLRIEWSGANAPQWVFLALVTVELRLPSTERLHGLPKFSLPDVRSQAGRFRSLILTLFVFGLVVRGE